MSNIPNHPFWPDFCCCCCLDTCFINEFWSHCQETSSFFLLFRREGDFQSRSWEKHPFPDRHLCFYLSAAWLLWYLFQNTCDGINAAILVGLCWQLVSGDAFGNRHRETCSSQISLITFSMLILININQKCFKSIFVWWAGLGKAVKLSCAVLIWLIVPYKN